jgi:hypothetical protein
VGYEAEAQCRHQGAGLNPSRAACHHVQVDLTRHSVTLFSADALKTTSLEFPTFSSSTMKRISMTELKVVGCPSGAPNDLPTCKSMSQKFESWNQVDRFLRQVNRLRCAA